MGRAMTDTPTEALALVTVTLRGVWHVLLIERVDGAGWAMPGGAIEPGERPYLAALRELQEETGIQLNLAANVQGGPPYWSLRGTLVKGLVHLDASRWVPDPRGSMEAWAVTVVARCDLGEVGALPEVRGGGDARRAEWIAVEGLWQFMNLIFPAHREILGALNVQA